MPQTPSRCFLNYGHWARENADNWCCVFMDDSGLDCTCWEEEGKPLLSDQSSDNKWKVWKSWFVSVLEYLVFCFILKKYVFVNFLWRNSYDLFNETNGVLKYDIRSIFYIIFMKKYCRIQQWQPIFIRISEKKKTHLITLVWITRNQKSIFSRCITLFFVERNSLWFSVSFVERKFGP